MNLKKIHSPTLKELFIDQMQHLILTGRLPVGAKLPAERDMMEQMSVSKTVIRAGLSELEGMGFVVTRPHDGVYVADYHKIGTPEVLGIIMSKSGEELNATDVRSLLELRIAVDSMVAKLIIQRADDEQIASLSVQLAAIHAAESPQALAQALFDFHYHMSELSQNSIFPLLYQSTREVMCGLASRYFKLYGNAGMFASRSRLLAHLINREVEAAVACVQDYIHEILDGSKSLL